MEPDASTGKALNQGGNSGRGNYRETRTRASRFRMVQLALINLVIVHLLLLLVYLLGFAIVVTTILQESGSNIEVMNDLMDQDEITRGIDPYCPYKCFHGGSTRGP